ncbi:hypothetical protein ACKLNO_05070 [Neisseriaceae bacterium B1]
MWFYRSCRNANALGEEWVYPAKDIVLSFWVPPFAWIRPFQMMCYLGLMGIWGGKNL